MLCAPSGGPESLLVAVLLLVLLSVWPGQASLTTQELTDVPTGSPTPSLNLKFDPRTLTLSWDCQENATSATCWMNHKEEGDIELTVDSKDCQCAFRSRPLHGGVTLKVSLTVDQGTIEEELNYTNPGAEGTAAQNLSCVIYNADFMNCTWARGPAAPSDVQYFLYIRQLKNKRETECPHYIRDSGTHRGCHLQDLSILEYKILFLVNGTSRGSQIQFFDVITSIKEIEQISPPDNISVHCNSSHCVLQWNQPRTKTSLSYEEFQYQLSIQRQNTERAGRDNSVINVSGEAQNQYSLPSPEPRGSHSLRIRASDSRRGQWGPWSRPVEFGSQGQEASLLHVYLLVVLGTLVCALVLGFLLHRFHGMQRLFPPIPQVKDKVSQNDHVDHQMDWADVSTGTGKEDLEDVLTVEEVS